MATAAEPLPHMASRFRADEGTVETDDGLSTFVAVRQRLFGIAYRMLGTAAEAEDILQDVWLRWQFAIRSAVENPPAFLAMTTARLCLNLVHSARSRHEACVGTSFPEPVDTGSDPESGAERGEALDLAVRVLLEKLSPAERAAYILREAFDYPYEQIATFLQLKEANTRQLVARARKHIAGGRRIYINAGEQRDLLRAFIAAARNGDMASLEETCLRDVRAAMLQRTAGVNARGIKQKLRAAGLLARTAHADESTTYTTMSW